MWTLALAVSLASNALSAKSLPFSRPSGSHLTNGRLGHINPIRIQVQVLISHVALCLFELQSPYLSHAHGTPHWPQNNYYAGLCSVPVS